MALFSLSLCLSVSQKHLIPERANSSSGLAACQSGVELHHLGRRETLLRTIGLLFRLIIRPLCTVVNSNSAPLSRRRLHIALAHAEAVFYWIYMLAFRRRQSSAMPRVTYDKHE